MKNITKILSILVLLLGITLAVVSIVGFKYIENRISFLNEQMWSKHPEVMQNSIGNDYPFAIYLKDTIVNVGLYKNATQLLLILVIIAGVSLLFLYFRKA